METTEMKAQRIVDKFTKMTNDQRLMDYKISCCDIYSICFDYLMTVKSAEEFLDKIKRMDNYIRLLEKENKELRGEK